MISRSITFLVIVVTLLFAGQVLAAQQPVSPRVVTIQSQGCSFCYPEFKPCTASDCKTMQNGAVMLTLESFSRQGMDIIAVFTVVNLLDAKTNITLYADAYLDNSVGRQVKAKMARLGTSENTYGGVSANFAPKQPLRAVLVFEGSSMSGEVALSVRLLEGFANGLNFTFFRQTLR